MLRKIKNNWSTILLVIIVLILVVPSWRVSFQGWFQGLFSSDIEFVKTENQKIPPSILNWEIEDMSANKFELKTFIGKPILLSFWATWCPPCRVELKELKKLHSNLGEEMSFISVSDERVATIKNSGLNEKYNFLYSTNAFPAFFNITSYPTLYVIDKDGIVIFKHEGAGGLDNEKNISFLKGLIEKG